LLVTPGGRKTEIEELLGRAAELEEEGRAADSLEQAGDALTMNLAT
jgi:hypothetical protein